MAENPYARCLGAGAGTRVSVVLIKPQRSIPRTLCFQNCSTRPSIPLSYAARAETFDADRFLRMLVETVGGGVFQRAAWPPPAALLEGEPIGLTYCVQTWFRYYLQQWITDAMSALETGEGVF